MKYLLFPLILIFSSCATTGMNPQPIHVKGHLLGAFVSTSSGLHKGHILHVSEANEINKVSIVGNGNPKAILLIHAEPKSLDALAGKIVEVSGQIRKEHVDMHHTDFVLNVSEISESK